MIRRLPALVAFLLAAPIPAHAQFAMPAAEGWTVTIGGGIAAVPAWTGSSRLGAFAFPRLSLRAPGAPERFASFDDGISPALLDLGWLRAGPNIDIVAARRARDDGRLTGLSNVALTIEAGAFAELYPVDWLRLRAALRQGVNGHGGLVGDLGADAIWRPDRRWTLSAGPRAFFGNERFASRYFAVSPAESLASGLSAHATQGGLVNYGAAAQVSYRFDAGWTVTGFAAFRRLAGDAASSPIVTQRGSASQLTAGTSATYSFTLGR